MSLVICPSCGRKNVSDTTEMCPGCGYNIKKHFSQKKVGKKDSSDDYIKFQLKQDILSEEQIMERLEKQNMEHLEKQLSDEWKVKIIATLLAIIGIIIGIASYHFKANGVLIALSFGVAAFCIAGLVMSSGSIEQMERELSLMQTSYKEWERQKNIQSMKEVELFALKEATAPRCPHCNSTNIKQISMLNRMISVEIFGLASSKIGKQFECKNCKYKW